MAWRSVIFATVLLAGCGAPATSPTSEPTSFTSVAEPFPPFDGTPIAATATIPNYVGAWKGTGALTGCHGPGPTCSRQSQQAAFFPPSIALVLDQQGIVLFGTMSVSGVRDTQVFGTITADGGFVISGSQPVFDTQFYVSAKFTRIDDDQINGTVVTETRLGGRLSYTFRYSVNAAKQE